LTRLLKTFKIRVQETKTDKNKSTSKAKETPNFFRAFYVEQTK